MQAILTVKEATQIVIVTDSVGLFYQVPWRHRDSRLIFRCNAQKPLTDHIAAYGAALRDVSDDNALPRHAKPEPEPRLGRRHPRQGSGGGQIEHDAKRESGSGGDMWTCHLMDHTAKFIIANLIILYGSSSQNTLVRGHPLNGGETIS